MKSTKKIICTIAAVAMVMWAYTPARAEFITTLKRDTTPTVTVANASNAKTSVRVYYLDRRGVDVILISFVPPGESVVWTLEKIGRATQCVIIEVDVPQGGTSTVTVNNLAPIRMGGADSPITTGRLVYDVED